MSSPFVYFNSLAPCGANPPSAPLESYNFPFQLPRPVWGEPVAEAKVDAKFQFSTHSPRVGRTHRDSGCYGARCNFNSLAPCGANLVDDEIACTAQPFRLTRPVWGEPNAACDDINRSGISTHSPRVGRTYDGNNNAKSFVHFNSLAPCGANLKGDISEMRGSSFQLTRPVWGEPRCGYEGETQCEISTHSPRVGRTFSVNSTKSACSLISTHSPRVGRTLRVVRGQGDPSHFNSLAPCGANRGDDIAISHSAQFQLTRPVWGEPPKMLSITRTTEISTHSPRVGRTRRGGGWTHYRAHFNSLAPCGANLSHD